MRLALALLGLAAAASGFAPAAPHGTARSLRANDAAPLSTAPVSPSSSVRTTALFANAGVAVDAQLVIDEAITEGGVALFGKSGCPFCKKTKKALYAIGVHPTVVELDLIDGGAVVQKKLEEITGKATVPNVWLDGKFVGGSEEVLAGIEGTMFDGVEKKEIIEIEDEPKVPVPQAEGALKAGDTVPDVGLWQGFPDDTRISLLDISKDKNILVVGLPGAFTPTWSSQQVPAYIEYEDKLKEAGVDKVYVYCVNDPAVMTAWATDQGVKVYGESDEGFVTFFSDADGSFTKACEMEMTHPGPLSVGIIGRCKRWAFYAAKGGEVKVVNVSEYEGDPAGDGYPEITLPAAMIEAIKAA